MNSRIIYILTLAAVSVGCEGGAATASSSNLAVASSSSSSSSSSINIDGTYTYAFSRCGAGSQVAASAVQKFVISGGYMQQQDQTWSGVSSNVNCGVKNTKLYQLTLTATSNSIIFNGVMDLIHSENYSSPNDCTNPLRSYPSQTLTYTIYNNPSYLILEKSDNCDGQGSHTGYYYTR